MRHEFALSSAYPGTVYIPLPSQAMVLKATVNGPPAMPRVPFAFLRAHASQPCNHYIILHIIILYCTSVALYCTSVLTLYCTIQLMDTLHTSSQPGPSSLAR